MDEKKSKPSKSGSGQGFQPRFFQDRYKGFLMTAEKVGPKTAQFWVYIITPANPLALSFSSKTFSAPSEATIWIDGFVEGLKAAIKYQEESKLHELPLTVFE